MPTVALTGDGEKLQWDGSPQTKYEWYRKLPETLDALSSAYRTLWQSGYVLDTRGKVHVYSDAHALHLMKGNVEAQPFNKPNLFGEFKLVSAPKKTEGDADERYCVAPESLAAKDRDLFTAITRTIDNQKRREDYEGKTKGSGLALIKLLSQEIENASVEIGQWAARMLADHIASGLPSATAVAFDNFRKRYEDINSQLPQTRRNGESVIADTYTSVVRLLGDHIGTRLDLQLMVLKQSKLAKGETVSLTDTVTCILELLSDWELRHGTGQALKVNQKKVYTPFVWTEGKHEICSICEGKHGGGRHLRRDCPDYKPAADPVKRPKVAKSNAPKEASNTKGNVKIAVSSSADEELDIYGGDVGLSTLFDDDTDDSDHDVNENDAEADMPTGPPPGVGSSLVARSPGSFPKPGSAAKRTPVSNDEARRRVEGLSPVSPLCLFEKVNREIGSGVSLRTGGPDRRSRIEILGEMRAAVGLDPYVIPVGWPVGPSVATPPPIEHSSELQTELLTPPSGEPPMTPARTAEDKKTAITPPPITFPPTSGAPRFLEFTIGTDAEGRICHRYRFEGENDATWIHDGEYGMPFVNKPPPSATFLGRSVSGEFNYWGTSEGRLVATASRL